MPRATRKYGWIPDLPDQRDFAYAAPPAVLRKLPAQSDLRGACPPVYNQGRLGSCTANAVAAAHEFEQIKQDAKTAFLPSRLFIYYNERVIEHSVDEDRGAMLRDGIKSVVKQGTCPETEWPYLIPRFAQKPPARCYKHALEHQVVSYRRLPQSIEQMKGCLASGYPFVFGFSVYESFESAATARTGKVSMPSGDEAMLGGHAVMTVGYADAGRYFIVRNSWGPAWGLEGYCLMPYAYLVHADLAADFWTIRMVEMDLSGT
ncbi:MAG: C1 family peptidase [Pseudomonadota bacterium]